MRTTTFFLTLISLLIGLTSCNIKQPLSGEYLIFQATNLSLSLNSDKSIVATSTGPDISQKVIITMDINGVPTSTTLTYKTRQLPVRAGDEIELTFHPSFPEETEAFISLPDGSNQKVTASSPSFKWVVPDNFTDEMVITGDSHYETDKIEATVTGKIRLVALDKLM